LGLTLAVKLQAMQTARGKQQFRSAFLCRQRKRRDGDEQQSEKGSQHAIVSQVIE
jgi:hypothetical protein